MVSKSQWQPPKPTKSNIMASKSAAADRSAKKQEIPPIITIPKQVGTCAMQSSAAVFTDGKQILSAPGKEPEARQRPCLLLDLPPEVLGKIVRSKNLSVFDRSCLMLTCKDFARYVTIFKGKLAPGGEITPGEEEYRLERILDADGWSSEDDEGLEAEYAQLKKTFSKRIAPQTFSSFYQLLDLGWNTGQSRFCFGCGIFQSTNQDYWDKRIETYIYKTVGKVGQAWRYLRDCDCDHTVEEFVEPWIGYEGRRGEEIKPDEKWCSTFNANFVYLRCPQCVVVDRCGCDCDCMYDHGCGCPCAICHKECCTGY